MGVARNVAGGGGSGKEKDKSRKGGIYSQSPTINIDAGKGFKRASFASPSKVRQPDPRPAPQGRSCALPWSYHGTLARRLRLLCLDISEAPRETSESGNPRCHGKSTHGLSTIRAESMSICPEVKASCYLDHPLSAGPGRVANVSKMPDFEIGRDSISLLLNSKYGVTVWSGGLRAHDGAPTQHDAATRDIVAYITTGGKLSADRVFESTGELVRFPAPWWFISTWIRLLGDTASPLDK